MRMMKKTKRFCQPCAQGSSSSVFFFLSTFDIWWRNASAQTETIITARTPTISISILKDDDAADDNDRCIDCLLSKGFSIFAFLLLAAVETRILKGVDAVSPFVSCLVRVDHDHPIYQRPIRNRVARHQHISFISTYSTTILYQGFKISVWCFDRHTFSVEWEGKLIIMRKSKSEQLIVTRLKYICHRE